MKFILGLGKVLTVVFWGVALFNWLMPQPLPFNLLINATGIVLLSLHFLEVLFFQRQPAWAQPPLVRSAADPAHRYFSRHVHPPSAGGASPCVN